MGSFEVFRTGHWMLHPGTITVYVHDTIEFEEFEHMDPDELRTKHSGNRFRADRGRLEGKTWKKPEGAGASAA